MIIGYTSGVYDMFHIGHLNIIKNAKANCDYLIVGVSTDDVVKESKHKSAVIPFSERIEIVKALKYVDKVVPQERYDVKGKVEIALKYHVDVMFVGSDWKGTEKWNMLEEELAKISCQVQYLPYTDGITSTKLAEYVKKHIENKIS